MIRSYSFQNSHAFPMACATFETNAQKTLGTLACSAIYDSFSWNASFKPWTEGSVKFVLAHVGCIAVPHQPWRWHSLFTFVLKRNNYGCSNSSSLLLSILADKYARNLFYRRTPHYR